MKNEKTPTQTDAATPRLFLSERMPNRFPSITIGGKSFNKKNRIIVNQIDDEMDSNGIDEHWRIAALIVRAVNLLEAHEAVAKDASSLEEMLRQTVGAFAVTLMVLDERANGETDPEKRYQFAEGHHEIKRARLLLKNCEALAHLAKLKETL